MRLIVAVLLLVGCTTKPDAEPVEVFHDVYQSLTPNQRDKFVSCLGGGQAFLIELEVIKECTIEAVK